MSRPAFPGLAGLRRRFGRLTPRERLLAALIGAAALLIWAQAMARDFLEQRERLDRADSLKTSRDAWLAVAPTLDRALAARASALATSRTMDAETTLGLLEKLLAKSGLSAESSRPTTREGGVYREHSVTLRAEGATLAQIVAFRRAMDASGLPMATTSLEIEAGLKPDEVRARLTVVALQLK